MICPHCGKETNMQDISPYGLLIHLQRRVTCYDKDVEIWEKQNNLSSLENAINIRSKWQAWADWVEKKIEKDKPHE